MCHQIIRWEWKLCSGLRSHQISNLNYYFLIPKSSITCPSKCICAVYLQPRPRTYIQNMLSLHGFSSVHNTSWRTHAQKKMMHPDINMDRHTHKHLPWLVCQQCSQSWCFPLCLLFRSYQFQADKWPSSWHEFKSTWSLVPQESHCDIFLLCVLTLG